MQYFRSSSVWAPGLLPRCSGNRPPAPSSIPAIPGTQTPAAPIRCRLRAGKPCRSIPVTQQGMDAKTFVLYGGSYGGFITLMAMFAQPDVFTADAALLFEASLK